jgi:hypothetical protein
VSQILAGGTIAWDPANRDSGTRVGYGQAKGMDRREREDERLAAGGDPEAAERVRRREIQQAVREHYDRLAVPCHSNGLSHRLDSPRPLTWRDRLEIPYDDMPSHFYRFSTCRDCCGRLPVQWVNQRDPSLDSWPKRGDAITSPRMFMPETAVG